MKVIICENYDEMSLRAAEILADAIHGKRITLGLATGSTPEGMYARLVELNREGKCDFSGVVSFNLDEYYPIKADNDQSYRYFMDKHLFNHVNIDKAKTHVPDGSAADPDAECQKYEDMIAAAGGIDLQVIGVGPNGHIGFNEPADELYPLTHLTGLSAATVNANKKYFASKDEMPKQALTMGMKSILSAKHIVALASGKVKHPAIAKLREGMVTTEWPLTLLNLHSNVTLICDKEAFYG